MAYSDTIKTTLQGLQNEAPVYFSQIKVGILIPIAAALTALGQTAGGTAVTAFANGHNQEHIEDWATLLPVLNGSDDAVQQALALAGATVTDLNALLQAIPAGPGIVFDDQFKAVFTEIADILAGLGQ